MSNNHSTQPPAPTVWEAERVRAAEEETARAQRRVKSLTSLHSAAEVVRIFGWLIAACGIAVGFVAVLNSGNGAGGGVVGVAVVLGSILFGAVLNLFGRWATAWAEHADR